MAKPAKKKKRTSRAKKVVFSEAAWATKSPRSTKQRVRRSTQRKRGAASDGYTYDAPTIPPPPTPFRQARGEWRASKLPIYNSTSFMRQHPNSEFDIDSAGFIQTKPKIERGVQHMEVDHMLFPEYRDSDVQPMEVGGSIKHPGFRVEAQRISREQHIPLNQADAILAASSRGASASAKRFNPRLNRV